MGIPFDKIKKTASFKTMGGWEVSFCLSAVYRIGVRENKMVLFWDCDFDGEGGQTECDVSEDEYRRVLELWTRYMESDLDE